MMPQLTQIEPRQQVFTVHASVAEDASLKFQHPGHRLTRPGTNPIRHIEQLLLAGVRQPSLAEQVDSSARWQQSRDALEQRRLTRSVRADQSENLAWPGIQGHIVK